MLVVAPGLEQLYTVALFIGPGRLVTEHQSEGSDLPKVGKNLFRLILSHFICESDIGGFSVIEDLLLKISVEFGCLVHIAVLVVPFLRHSILNTVLVFEVARAIFADVLVGGVRELGKLIVCFHYLNKIL